MKAGDLTIMLRFSATPHVDMRKTSTHGADLFATVINVSWYQPHGDWETFFSERWKQVAPNMWLDTSPKSLPGMGRRSSKTGGQNLRE